MEPGFSWFRPAMTRSYTPQAFCQSTVSRFQYTAHTHSHQDRVSCQRFVYAPREPRTWKVADVMQDCLHAVIRVTERRPNDFGPHTRRSGYSCLGL